MADSSAVVGATADAHRLALNSPDAEKPLVEQSPQKVAAKPAFVPLSPGPEKAKLHMDAVASLLGLSSSDAAAKAAAAAAATAAVKPGPTTIPPLDQWTVVPSAAPSAPFRAAKRLTPPEIYSRSLSIPRGVFESLFGKQGGASTTALVEHSGGSLLTLAAEAPGAGAAFSLRAGPLVNALRASAGDVLVLTALDAQAAASGAPPRARATIGYPADAAATATGAAVGPESRSASGSPGSLDSLTQLSDGEGTGAGTDGDAGAGASDAGAYLLDRLASTDAADDAGAAVDGDADPEWREGGGRDGVTGGPRTRGRPRKRKPFATFGSTPRAAAAAAAANLSCSHCGTRETPRWWKDAFPLGTLCNACGIWLKRHGYPRPVQFFSVPSATGGPGAAAAMASARGGTGMNVPAPGDFYLINGRPKRRRAAVNASFTRGDAEGTAAAAAAMAMAAGAAPAPAAPADAINYGAAGGKAFVMRRKLISGGASGTTATPEAATPGAAAGPVNAALVHFGWAPGSRAAHQMFDKVAGYPSGALAAAAATGAAPAAPSAVSVEDFELLGDTKATATLTLRAGAEAPADWDALVRHFVESL